MGADVLWARAPAAELMPYIITRPVGGGCVSFLQPVEFGGVGLLGD